MKVLVFNCRKVLEINCRKLLVFTCFLEEYREYEERLKRTALDSLKSLFAEAVRPRTPKKRKQKATNEWETLNDTA